MNLPAGKNTGKNKHPVTILIYYIRETFAAYRWKEQRLPLTIIGLTLLFVGLCWWAIYLVDVHNFAGISSSQGLWWHLFRNRGPVEYVQWFFLALTTLASAALFGYHLAREERPSHIFWGLVSVSFILMLIEDAGDPRHIIARYTHNFLGWEHKYVEGAFFIAVAFPVVFAFLRYWKVHFHYPQTRLYLLSGAALYGAVATTSVLRHQEEIYRRLGERLSPILFEGNIPGFHLMDFMVEESVELLASAIFFTGVFVYWRMVIMKNHATPDTAQIKTDTKTDTMEKETPS